jgi:glyoxylase-like metal-dependent hydrolase (beta-lactamase superfamily II)
MATYRFRVGNLDCIAVEDYPVKVPARRLFSNVSDLELEREMRTHGLDIGGIPGSSVCLVVRTDVGWVLFDTGHGLAYGKPGHLLSGLHAEGIEPSDIQAVVLSHAHVDHIGGLLDAQDKLVFAHADYYVGRVEWESYASERELEDMQEQTPERARQLRRYLHPLRPRLHLMDHHQEFMPGMVACLTPGHSNGQMTFKIESNGECVVYAADVMIHPLHIEHAEWEYFTDGNPRIARQSRAHFIRCAVEENWLILAYHFPFPGLGHIVQSGTRSYRFEPLVRQQS